ncbi:MAG: type II toxin-antitoxin system VapC family toxin [Burkholderiales bacterium]
MIYVDSSVVLSLLAEDDLTPAAESWFGSTSDPVALSSWTEVEVFANVGLRVRKKFLSRGAGLAVRQQFIRLVETNFRMLAALDEHFKTAREWLASSDCALGSNDALHLAIAFGHGCKSVVTFDRTLVSAAKRLKLDVRLP